MNEAQMPTSTAEPSRGRGPLIFAVVLSGVALALAAVGVGKLTGDDKSPSATGTTGSKTIDIELGDLFIRGSSTEAAAGDRLVFMVRNSGKTQHNFVASTGGAATPLLDPGATAQLEAGPFDKDIEFICDVPGHAQAGMKLTLSVSGATGASPKAADTADNTAKIDFSATPPAGWQMRDPRLPAAPAGRVHRITMRAIEKVIEVAPGVKQEVWTFEGISPGPTLRGRVGDIFEVTLRNEGKVGHSIDFHSSKVAWNDEMRTIGSGESLVYRYEAKHSGVFMYHCGTAPALHHIGNGMFGAIVIDPPNLPPVDHEYVLVQSELYTGPQGKPGDLAKMQRSRWDAVVFNGYVNQYQHKPIRVEPRQRVRVWVLDAGPNENSSFHIVGTIFDTLYKEGAYQLRPDASRGGAQALDLQPAQGGFVEFTFDEAGLYPIVTHKFANVGIGALGIFQAGEVAPSAAGGH